jgi:uncharacterized protein YjiK
MAPINHPYMMTILLFLFLAQACQDIYSTEIPYRLNTPDETFHLPGVLEEISGLSMGADGNTLLAVDDETGNIFVIDKNTGELLREIPFWKDGDYEGIELVGEDIFVAKSNGNLYQVQNLGTDTQTVLKHELPLDKAADVEGLAYEPENNRLLVACKGETGIPNARAIYALPLETMTLDPEPVYVIYWDSVAAFLQDKPELSFAPSGLAINPINDRLYVLSSVGKMLLAIDRSSGKVVDVMKLKKKTHPQPEGICFDADGTLFISNEGKGDQATLHRFNLNP